MQETPSTRLLVISNRLPVTIKKNDASSQSSPDAQQWAYTLSSGGLVSALSGLKKFMSFIWIGWPGFEVVEDEQERLKDELMQSHACLPVFISDEIIDLYYNGFSNSTLWPLFHYLPGEIDFNEHQWDGYYRANAAFANAIKEVVQDGDIIWVQDYHLMLLPSLLREVLVGKPNVRIGFFLHTPFPSSEVYRVLPVRKQLLLGVLQCDLIGFHTYDYARHFLSSCARVLGLSALPNGIEYDGRFVHVGIFPIGIDPDKFINALDTPHVKKKIEELEKRFAGKKLMVGVDRLDYIKGVPHKLHAFDQFLTRYPEFQGKVALLQVAVPTRTKVEEYKDLRTSVNELVGRINGKFGSFDFTPVQYLYRSVSFEDLVALYRVANVCVVTSTRDGMNLVSYEFIATQKEKNGVLILSEFAGAAQSMNGSIIVNPWSIDELVESYHEALTMPTTTAERNHQKLFQYVTKHTASYWGQSFVAEMQNIAKEQAQIKRYIPLTVDPIRGIFKSPSLNTKLILLSLDSLIIEKKTLLFRDFKGGKAQLSSFIEVINQLSLIPNTLVYLLSSVSRKAIERKIGNTANLGLVCENGCFLLHSMQLRLQLAKSSPKSARGEEWIGLAEHCEESWRERARPLVKFYAEHTPGAVIEEREKLIVWNFSECEREFGLWQAGELQANLEKVFGHAPVKIVLEAESLEIGPSLIDKAVAARRILTDLHVLSIDMVLCIDDSHDEALFSFFESQLSSPSSSSTLSSQSEHSSPSSISTIVPPIAPIKNLFTATIGKHRSNSRYYLASTADLISIFTDLLK